MNQVYTRTQASSSGEPEDAMFVSDVAQALGLTRQGFNHWLTSYTARHGQDYWKKRYSNNSRVKVLLHEMRERRKLDGLAYGMSLPQRLSIPVKKPNENITPLPVSKPVDQEWAKVLDDIQRYHQQHADAVVSALLDHAKGLVAKKSA